MKKQHIVQRIAWIALVITFTLVLAIFMIRMTSHPVLSANPSANVLSIDTIGEGIGTSGIETRDLAWGDLDNDGDLDLAVANKTSTVVYANEGGALTLQPAWVRDGGGSNVVAWGDVDGDGDLDLAANARVFINQSNMLSTTHSWQAAEGGGADTVAWGDINGDGALDLVVGNGSNLRLYLNLGAQLETTATWTISVDRMRHVALGDADGDGDLDLAVAAGVAIDPQRNRLYLNDQGSFSVNADWLSAESDTTESVVWGDIDRDGDLDLAVGNWGQPNRIYFNQGGGLETGAGWSSAETNSTASIMLGDVNNDGWLDLASSNESSQANTVHLNNSGMLQSSAGWASADAEVTNAAALADVDNDGDLDFAVGNRALNRLYRNNTGSLETTAASDVGPVGSALAAAVAWGDVDGDGDLDAAIVGERNAIVLQNNDGQLASAPVWTGASTASSFAVAWADADGDGDLDLALGGTGKLKLFDNVNGALSTIPVWQSAENNTARGLAWADVDQDGDLDLVSGNIDQSNRLYLNDNGQLAISAAWLSDDADSTSSVAWGDIDQDGDLDLAVGNDSNQANRLYRNDDGALTAHAVWASAETNRSSSIALGDMDGDGDLDLAVGNELQANQLYENVDGALTPSAVWVSAESDHTNCIAWGDVDNDGDLDLATANGSFSGEANRIYLNSANGVESVASWVSDEVQETYCLAWGDSDSDGRLDLLVANNNAPNALYENQRVGQLANSATSAAQIGLQSDPTVTFGGSSADFASADFFAMPAIRDGIVPVKFSLHHPQNNRSGQVRLRYSLNGGDNWQVAVPTSATQTSDLAQAPYPTVVATNTHTFYWDTFASGFFGQSDNVVLRLEVASNYSSVNGTPFPIQQSAVAAQSYPLRVRGTQVRVVSDTQPLHNAIVFKQTAGTAKFTTLGSSGTPFVSDQNGYLRGDGTLGLGDKLVALVPIEATADYRLYHMSAAATLTGVSSADVLRSGVQTLTVSAENPLLLFDIDVSLEWDPRNNPAYIASLNNNFQATSRILFDLTNGQVALGNINVHVAREQWHTSDVVIFASNTTRPSADVGGIATGYLTDTLKSGDVITQAYFPGQVRMPATWNRFGSPTGNQGDDWARAMAHELSHYLLYQLDNYLGVSPSGNLTLVDCRGSAMTEAYSPAYSELATRADWVGDCLQTVANQTTGRTDWETLTHFYPALNGDLENVGPADLPLAVTNLVFDTPPEPATTLINPFVEIRTSEGAPLATSSGAVSIFLTKRQGTSNIQDDYLIPLGSPVVGTVLARGASEGDRLCVYDNRTAQRQAGCIEQMSAASDSLTVAPLGDWNPQVAVIPPYSNTLIISVTGASSSDLMVQVYPSTLFSDTLVPTAVTATLVPVTGQPGTFSQTITLDAPSFRGAVRLWEMGTGRESISHYYFGGGWGPTYVGWGPTYVGWGPTYVGWGPTYVGWGANRVGWGIGRNGWNAPVQSASGQVTVFDLDNILGPTPPYILQDLATPPDAPSWLTPVGSAHQFISPIPFTGTHSILFNYLQRDVPNQQWESQLSIYHLAPSVDAWQRLPTELDITDNIASATLPDEGVFMLASAIEAAQLLSGPNNVAYPGLLSRPITEAVASIDGLYSSVYQFDAATGWHLFDPAVRQPFADRVNSLADMQFGAYWIYATEPTTWYVPVDSAAARQASAPQAQEPPMVVYGWITATDGSIGLLNETVTARTEGVDCGSAPIELLDGNFSYVLQVKGEDGCNVFGRNVELTVSNSDLTAHTGWRNDSAVFLSIGSAVPTSVLLVSANPHQPSQLALLTASLMLMILTSSLVMFWMGMRKRFSIGC